MYIKIKKMVETMSAFRPRPRPTLKTKAIEHLTLFIGIGAAICLILWMRVCWLYIWNRLPEKQAVMRTLYLLAGIGLLFLTREYLSWVQDQSERRFGRRLRHVLSEEVFAKQGPDTENASAREAFFRIHLSGTTPYTERHEIIGYMPTKKIQRLGHIRAVIEWAQKDNLPTVIKNGVVWVSVDRRTWEEVEIHPNGDGSSTFFSRKICDKWAESFSFDNN